MDEHTAYETDVMGMFHLSKEEKKQAIGPHLSVYIAATQCRVCQLGAKAVLDFTPALIWAFMNATGQRIELSEVMAAFARQAVARAGVFVPASEMQPRRTNAR